MANQSGQEISQVVQVWTLYPAGSYREIAPPFGNRTVKNSYYQPLAEACGQRRYNRRLPPAAKNSVP